MMRSDAVANRARLISAARDVVLQHGPDVALQEVADAAGVGIATLYRHFEDRQSLFSAVVIQSLDSVIESAAHASSSSPTTRPADALAFYLHAVIDLRVSAVIPMLLDCLDMYADDIRRARDRSAAAFTKLVDAAHAAGELAAGVSVGDLGVLLVRLSRPLPGRWETSEEIAMAHRHLDLILRGAGWTDLDVPVVELNLDEMYESRSPAASGQSTQRRTRMDDGTYITLENRPAVRFERDYAYPIQQVWQAISAPDQARRWFPSTLLFEPEAGGVVRFSDDPNTADREGVVLDYDPPHALSFTWGDGEVHITLEPFADNQCRFVLINVLAADNEAARNAAGWTVCLDEFDKVIRGEESDGPHADSTTNWQASYDAYVRSGMPAGATIPG